MSMFAELERPAWLEPGARVLVRSTSSKAPAKVRTVLAVEWPWLVYFEGHPGATHGKNVLRLAEPGEL